MLNVYNPYYEPKGLAQLVVANVVGHWTSSMSTGAQFKSP